MKKFNFNKILPWVIVLGFLLGLVFAICEINIISYIVPISILLIIFTMAVSAYFILKELNYQQSLLNTGRYNELIKYLLDKHEQYSGKMGYRQQYLVFVANCCNRMGNFQESLSYLEKIQENKMDNKTKAGYYLLYSSNLYFLNQSLNKADELINKSRTLLDMNESMLLHALIDIGLNKKEDARQLIEQYHKRGTAKKYMFGISTVLYVDEYTSKVSEKFMLGLYYKNIGDEENSIKYFSESANCDYRNYFSDISKEICKK